MTNEEPYGKIPSVMHQLREWCLTFAGHCCRCEDQPVKHLVLWEGRAGRMLRGQSNRITYVKQLLHDSCCETVDELQRMMKNRVEWSRVSHTTPSSEWLRSLRKWMDCWASPRRKITYSTTHSPSLFDLLGTIAYRLSPPLKLRPYGGIEMCVLLLLLLLFRTRWTLSN